MTECPELPRIHALSQALSQALADELPRTEAAHARAHLAGCARCRSELTFLMRLAMVVTRGVAAIDDLEAVAVAAAFGAIGRAS